MYAGCGVGVAGHSYEELYDALYTYERNGRRQEARLWVAAAFDAAVEGYDVREPARQLDDWITFGDAP